MKRKLKRIYRVWVMLIMRLYRGGVQRAEYLKKAKLFASFGDNCYWFPRKLPAEPTKIIIHDNVNIATDVYFCDHDVIQRMLNNVPEYTAKLSNGNVFPYQTYTIEICDNVFIGAHAILVGNIKIGPNAIVAAGSVVTKDVAPGTVVGGNPARVISTMEKFIEKRCLNI